LISFISSFSIQNQQKAFSGQAPYKNDDLANGTHSYTFAIPFGEDLECGTSIWIQAHASTEGETAYGGTIIGSDGGSWFGKILYFIECCERMNATFQLHRW
jgi:hypothetical protein